MSQFVDELQGGSSSHFIVAALPPQNDIVSVMPPATAEAKASTYDPVCVIVSVLPFWLSTVSILVSVALFGP